MGSERRFPITLLFVIFIVMTVTFGGELAVELSSSRYPEGHPQAGELVRIWSLEVSQSMVRQIATPISRSFTQLLAMVLTFIALAVPLTANHYTPRLLKIFLRDKTNLIVLCTLGLMSAHSVLTLMLSHDLLNAQLSFWITCTASFIGWLALIPYYFYVLQFLNPETIIGRVTGSLILEIEEIHLSREAPGLVQQRLNQKILDLGSVILKSGERSDRDVAVHATRAMEQAFRAYQREKARLPAAFFTIDQGLFTGLSKAAIEIINQDRTWVEQKCLGQLTLAYNAALSKMPDAVSTISDAVNHLAADTARLGDRPALDLLVRYFNTFIREAFKKKDTRAIYDVFYQYKSLARKLLSTHPDAVAEMVGHLRYYAMTAKQLGMPFIHELAGYELAELCESAHDRNLGKDNPAILAALLAIEGCESSVGLVKARAVLGSYFISRDLSDELEQILASLRAVPRPLQDQARREILETGKRIFWEVTDRQVNFDYVDDARKQQVGAFFDRLI